MGTARRPIFRDTRVGGASGKPLASLCSVISVLLLRGLSGPRGPRSRLPVRGPLLCGTVLDAGGEPGSTVCEYRVARSGPAAYGMSGMVAFRRRGA
ncbi:hypothetical protein GCM10010300_61340 [Streptomyces olivaceoviridis]|nr:hypothetical protein GCM10010300_61340 [Streptomyces olivaceoviridis]